MKFKLLLTSFVLFFTISGNAQDPTLRKEIDSILISESTKESERTLTYENSFWGIRTYKGRQPLNNKEVRNFLQTNPSLLQQYDRGRNKLILGNVLGVVGGFAFGYGLFTTVNAYNENYGFNLNDRVTGYSLIGGGVIAATAGVLMFFSGQEKMKLAIDAYNNDLLVASFQFGITPNGLGITVNF